VKGQRELCRRGMKSSSSTLVGPTYVRTTNAAATAEFLISVFNDITTKFSSKSFAEILIGEPPVQQQFYLVGPDFLLQDNNAALVSIDGITTGSVSLHTSSYAQCLSRAIKLGAVAAAGGGGGGGGAYDEPADRVLAVLQWMDGSGGKEKIARSGRLKAPIPAFNITPLTWEERMMISS